METLNLIQGSAEWLSHRATKFNASDAPAVLGCSPYKTRNELLHERATGMVKEIDAATQRRFDNGHKFEALARPLAEKIIGEPLSPVTGVNGKYSASFDGITFMEDICWEHKTLNDSLRNIARSLELPEHYCIQMEHQLLVSGASECLFSATKWDGEECVDQIHIWYESDVDRRGKLIAAWAQFEEDLAAYVPPVVVEKPQAQAIMQLPALFVQVKGEVTGSNLVEFKDAASSFIANIKTELVTDQDFADAEANVKACKTAEDDLEGAKKAMLAQTSTIDEVMKTIDFIKAQLASKRLMLDKLVKSEKEARKLAIIDKARLAFNTHVEALGSEINPVQLDVSRPDFAGAMKGLKKLSAMQEAVDTALRNGMFEADTVAKDIRAKLAGFQPWSAEYGFLFRDLQEIIYKPLPDFSLIVETRIAAHQKAEAEKLEHIRKEEQAKAEAKAKAEIDSVVAEIVEQFAQPEPVQQPRPAVLHTAPSVQQVRPKRPTREQIIAAVACAYYVSADIAESWIADEFQKQAA